MKKFVKYDVIARRPTADAAIQARSPRSRWSLAMTAACCIMLLSTAANAETKTETKPQTPMGQLAPGHDSNQPIKITADNLDVQQSEHIAIFTGNVIAIQGDTTLKSETMKVHYRNSNAGAPKVKAAAKQSNPGSVSLIEVYKNVFLTNPVQSAQGDNGTYDVDNHMVKLNGHVTLVKNKNIIKGDHLEYDTETGKSQIYSAADKTKPGGRVESVFVQEKQNPDKGKKQGDAKQGAKQNESGQ